MDRSNYLVVRWQGDNSLGSGSRGLFSDALQFLKRWFIQSPDPLFMFVSSRGISACTTTSYLEDHASEEFLWPRSSHGPTQGLGVVAISPSQCTFLPPKFYTDLCVLSLCSAPCPWEFTPFLLRIVISGVPGGSRAKRVFELEMWLWWWHWWQSPCDWLAQQGREEVPEGATRKE